MNFSVFPFFVSSKSWTFIVTRAHTHIPRTPRFPVETADISFTIGPNCFGAVGVPPLLTCFIRSSFYGSQADQGEGPEADIAGEAASCRRTATRASPRSARSSGAPRRARPTTLRPRTSIYLYLYLSICQGHCGRGCCRSTVALANKEWAPAKITVDAASLKCAKKSKTR